MAAKFTIHFIETGITIPFKEMQIVNTLAQSPLHNFDVCLLHQNELHSCQI